jgi:hypothetical protein
LLKLSGSQFGLKKGRSITYLFSLSNKREVGLKETNIKGTIPLADIEVEEPMQIIYAHHFFVQL